MSHGIEQGMKRTGQLKRWVRRQGWGMAALALACALLFYFSWQRPRKFMGQHLEPIRPIPLAWAPVTLRTPGSLRATLADLALQCHARIEIEATALAANKIDLDAPMKIKAAPEKPIPLHRALSLIRNFLWYIENPEKQGRKLAFAFEANRVICTTVDGIDAHRSEVRYPVGDLVSSRALAELSPLEEERRQRLEELVRDTLGQNSMGCGVVDVEDRPLFADYFEEPRLRVDGTPGEQRVVRELLQALRAEK